MYYMFISMTELKVFLGCAEFITYVLILAALILMEIVSFHGINIVLRGIRVAELYRIF